MPPSLAIVTFLAAVRWLEPGPEVVPSEVTYVEARHRETFVHRDLAGRRVRAATVARGTVLVVRGEVPHHPGDVRCPKGAYAVWPFGLVCRGHVRPVSNPPPAARPSFEPLPFRYALVRTDGTPAYEDEAAAIQGVPFRQLEKGMTLAVVGARPLDGIRYVRDVHGHLIPRDAVAYLGSGSAFRGIFLPPTIEPGATERLALLRRKQVSLRSAPSPRAPVTGRTKDRGIVQILARHPADDGAKSMVLVRTEDGAEGWIPARRVAPLRLFERPPEPVVRHLAATGHPNHTAWVHVDLGTQVAVVYRGGRPYFATLVSSGARNPTPRGLYPVWGIVRTIDMDNQAYEDDAYMVQQVPWSVFFQGHNALHGAYWHDGFGHRRSHGCVNLPPAAALWVYRFLGPALPDGWTGYFPAPERAPLVYVENSALGPDRRFLQERPPGPPDPEEEKRKTEEALARRRATPPANPGRIPPPTTSPPGPPPATVSDVGMARGAGVGDASLPAAQRPGPASSGGPSPAAPRPEDAADAVVPRKERTGPAASRAAPPPVPGGTAARSAEPQPRNGVHHGRPRGASGAATLRRP